MFIFAFIQLLDEASVQRLVNVASITHDFVVDFTTEFARSSLVKLLEIVVKRRTWMHTHYQLPWEVDFKLQVLIDKLVLRDHVQSVEQFVLLKTLDDDLLLSELLL